MRCFSIRLHPVPHRDLFKVLRKLGYSEVRQKGSHKVFKNDKGAIIVIPFHKGELIGRGLLRKIITHLGLSVDEFFELIEDP